MLGNDVVDLKDPETQAGMQHPRFDLRVFAQEERARIARSGAPERLRWIMWAAKEAAYKVARKLDARAVFAPSRFVVRADERLRGEVELPEGRRIPLVVRADAEFVHAIASDRADFERELVEGLGALGPCTARDESRRAREFATLGLARELGRPAEQLSIEKRGRIPQLLLAGVDAAVDLALSHHGRFAAFACELTQPLQRIEAGRSR